MAEPELSAYKDANKLNHTAVFLWDVRQDTFNYDEIMTEIMGRELPTKNFAPELHKARLVHPKDRTEFLRQLDYICGGQSRRQAEHQDFALDFRVYVAGRAYIWLHLACRAYYASGTAIKVAGFLQNATKTRQEQSKLQAAVEQDPMTGLYSKTHAAYLAGREISRPAAGHNALLVIDMDNFKQVNDKLGHLIGDAVILDIALNLKQIFRKTDILGHIGGDEFMVLMRDVPHFDLVREKCCQLRDLLRKNYTHNEETVSVSASIGIALSPEHGADYQTLFANADAALYYGKKHGKDAQTLYTPDFVTGRSQKTRGQNENSAEYQKLTSSPLEYIFHLMMKSPDTTLAVRILLEIFAKHFNVQRAYVFWHENGEYWVKAIFDYAAPDCTSAELAHNPEVRRLMRKRYRTTSYGKFTECSDTRTLPDSARKVFQAKQITAFLECAITEGEKFWGCVGFDDCRSAHDWSRAEHEVLQAFADIMQRFLIGQMYYEKAKKNSIWHF